jgi:hypothetical protein
MDGKINAVNRYSGPPNLSVSGQPVDGRSGGGLFSAEGVLIGVCNAADPQDNEGLYAAAGTVQVELDRSGLGFVYRSHGASLTGEPSGLPAAGLAQNRETQGTQPPEMPNLSRDQRGASSLPHGDDSEIICIIRSRSNPQAPSQVVRLEQPSADFLVRLARETSRGAGRDNGVDPRAGPPEAIRRNRNAPRSSPSPTVLPVMRGQTR